MTNRSVVASALTYLFVERPMQNVGRRVGRWLDDGSAPTGRRTTFPQSAIAGRSHPATE